MVGVRTNTQGPASRGLPAGRKAFPMAKTSSGPLQNSQQPARPKMARRNIPPKVVVNCIKYLSFPGNRAASVPDLFQICFTPAKLREIESKVIKARNDVTPKEVAAVLCYYFARSPNPLLTIELYDCVIEAARVEHSETRLSCLRHVLKLLPHVNRLILRKLLELFLKLLKDATKTEQLTKHRLGEVFAPLILRRPPTSVLKEVEVESEGYVVEILIEEFSNLFPQKPPPKPSKVPPEVPPMSALRLQAQRAAQASEEELPKSFRHSFRKASVIVESYRRGSSENPAPTPMPKEQPAPGSSFITSQPKRAPTHVSSLIGRQRHVPQPVVIAKPPPALQRTLSGGDYSGISSEDFSKPRPLQTSVSTTSIGAYPPSRVASRGDYSGISSDMVSPPTSPRSPRPKGRSKKVTSPPTSPKSRSPKRPSRRPLVRNKPAREPSFSGNLLKMFKNKRGDSRTLTPKAFVPPIVSDCLDYFLNVKNGALDEEGLFRVNGNATVMRGLQKKYEKKRNVNLENENCTAHDVAGLLKQYLSALPNPLLTVELYDCFIMASQIQGDVGLLSLRRILDILPPTNRAIIMRLLEVLQLVVANSDVNKMTVENLSVVFAPSLLRRPRLPFASVEEAISLLSEDLQDTSCSATIITRMFNNYDLLFLKDIQELENSCQLTSPSEENLKFEQMLENRKSCLTEEGLLQEIYELWEEGGEELPI